MSRYIDWNVGWYGESVLMMVTVEARFEDGENGEEDAR